MSINNVFSTLISLLIGIFFCGIAWAQPLPNQEPISQRAELSLDRGWRFHLGDIAKEV